ncbi:hypothetical protein I7I50_00959 [Histoplasma capsulatum G186AR]|uniref:Uncharacterized protein n=1 Tax=Ajellomyces capsulatus TaxID=5037 RepID=A0A8H7YJN5_AJECA|nr:hypothetical protein I7I52_08225 [Histoplasma capsulatum]QSS72955.1 hypothetical protein I7I50_00959 [Histoplasma capsulatum G186AR]
MYIITNEVCSKKKNMPKLKYTPLPPEMRKSTPKNALKKKKKQIRKQQANDSSLASQYTPGTLLLK